MIDWLLVLLILFAVAVIAGALYFEIRVLFDHARDDAE